MTDSTDWTFWPKTVLLSNPQAREISHVARFAWTALYWNVAVVLWGAYVRATGSGAGCGNRWPLCDGDVVGASAKGQTIVEFTHRITSAISLLIVTGLVVWCWRVTKKGDWARYSAALAVVFLANEALLGAALVLLKHVGNDQSVGRILFLCLHFGNTLLLLATLSLTAAWLSNGSRSFTLISKWREVGSIGLGLLATMVTGITGAVAALADTLYPATSLPSSLAKDFSSHTPALLRVRLLHPAVATIAACYVLWVIWRSSTARNRFSRSASALITLLFMQVVIGMTNVLFLAPVWIQIVHLFVADALWILLVLASGDLVLEAAEEGRKKVKRYGHIVTCCAIVAIAISGGLSADTTQNSYQLPSDAQVIGYLLQSVTWYRHLYTEQQVANDPGDLVFLNDNQALESQIVKLSFEFAKADAALAKTATSPHDAPATLAAPASADLAHFIELKNRDDQVTQQTSADIGKLNEKVASARKADRKNLKAALDDAQSRLELMQAVSQAVNDLIQFVQTARTAKANNATFDLTIEDLAQSIPELSSPATPLSKLPAQGADSRTSNSWRETGLLGLGSEVSALSRKLRVVDEKIRLTDDFLLSAKNIRTPMSGFITRALQKAATSNLQTSDLSLLREQKSQLDALTLELKAFSPAILALDKQKALLEEYESHLLPWRTAVASQYRQAWKNLVVRLLIVALIVGLLFGMGEISRRVALGRIQDPNRRRVISMVHRLLTMFAITVVTLVSVASDLSSLATYFGLLSAGLLLALQNVILASLGSLVLLGKRGIRVGDRVQVSGITGDVINMGLLQFQLREFDVEEGRFTGHVATFSNSLVFVSPSVGLLKFNSAPGKAAKAAVNNNGPQREASSTGPVPEVRGKN